MLGSTVFLVLILASISITGTRAEQRWDIYSSGNVSITTIDSQLYAVSKNFTHISIISEDSDYEPCELEWDVEHIGRIQTRSAKRVILLIYRHNKTVVQGLKIDPFLCIYTYIRDVETDVEISTEPQLIVIENSVDIFLEELNIFGFTCLPCRFDVNGNLLDVTGQLVDALDERGLKSWKVTEFVQSGLVRNFVLAGNFDVYSMLIIFNENFQETRVRTLDLRLIEAVAANTGPNGTWIGIIYCGTGNAYERVLALYNDGLELLFETRLKKQSSNHRIYDTLLSINLDGYSSVHSVQKPFYSGSGNMNYGIYDSEGRLHAHGDYDNSRIDVAYDWQLLQVNNSFCYASQQYRDESYQPIKSTIFCPDY